MYLGNYAIARTSFFMERRMLQKQILNMTPPGLVFITGLARSGTTALFNHIFGSQNFASLKYSDMPFLLMPNLWHSIHKTKPADLAERLHADGLLINQDSPEEFDEFFWKVFLNNNYVKEKKLVLHKPADDVLNYYDEYTRLICYLNKKQNYLSKNNNNILRLNALLNKFPYAEVILLYRNPLDHAASLMKLHHSFSELQEADAFMLSYFNYLGHYEFGKNHKPFSFGGQRKDVNEYFPRDINYWLEEWYNYYEYALAHFKEKVHFVAFEDLCSNPSVVNEYLYKVIGKDYPVIPPDKFSPKPYETEGASVELLNNCTSLYEKIGKQSIYRK